MEEFLKFSEIVISIALILIVLVQNKNVTLNLTDMSSWMWEITKRWAEKVIQNITIVLGVLFVLNSLALYFIIKI
jgi:protein translocase SecG subunit